MGEQWRPKIDQAAVDKAKKMKDVLDEIERTGVRKTQSGFATDQGFDDLDADDFWLLRMLEDSTERQWRENTESYWNLFRELKKRKLI